MFDFVEDLVLFASTNFWGWILSADFDESAVFRREVVVERAKLSLRRMCFYGGHLLLGGVVDSTTNWLLLFSICQLASTVDGLDIHPSTLSI